jgi:hypothetical protein
MNWNDTERAEILRDIRQLRQLIWLSLTGPEFTDADFVNQPPLPRQLMMLNLNETKLTWAGLDAATQRNRRLRNLSLFKNSTSPAFTKDCLQRFPALADVNIVSTPLTTNDIRALVSVPSIRELTITHCDLDSTQFALVRDRNFKDLYLQGITIDGQPISPEIRKDLKVRGVRVLWN